MTPAAVAAIPARNPAEDAVYAAAHLEGLGITPSPEGRLSIDRFEVVGDVETEIGPVTTCYAREDMIRHQLRRGWRAVGRERGARLRCRHAG